MKRRTAGMDHDLNDGKINSYEWKPASERKYDTFGQQIIDEKEEIGPMKDRIRGKILHLKDFLITSVTNKTSNDMDGRNIVILREIADELGIADTVNWPRIGAELKFFEKTIKYSIIIQEIPIPDEYIVMIRVYYLDSMHMEDIDFADYCGLQAVMLGKMKRNK